MIGTTTKIIAQHENDYFAAHVDDGSVRVGLLSDFCVDYAPGHPLRDKALEVAHDADALEEFADEAYTAFLATK